MAAVGVGSAAEERVAGWMAAGWMAAGWMAVVARATANALAARAVAARVHNVAVASRSAAVLLGRKQRARAASEGEVQ